MSRTVGAPRTPYKGRAGPLQPPRCPNPRPAATCWHTLASPARPRGIRLHSPVRVGRRHPSAPQPAVGPPALLPVHPQPLCRLSRSGPWSLGLTKVWRNGAGLATAARLPSAGCLCSAALTLSSPHLALVSRSHTQATLPELSVLVCGSREQGGKGPASPCPSGQKHVSEVRGARAAESRGLEAPRASREA